MDEAAKQRMIALNQRKFNKTDVFLKEIQPMLEKLATLCKQHGVPLLAVAVPSADGENYSLNTTQIEYPGTLSDELSLMCLLAGGKIPAPAIAAFLDMVYKMPSHNDQEEVGCACTEADVCEGCKQASRDDADGAALGDDEDFPMPSDKKKDGGVSLN
jgi:hypothetical protein